MDGDIQRDYDGTSLSSKGDHPSVSSRKESSTLSQKFGGYLSELRRWEIWRSIIIGQIVSALVSGTGVSCMFLQSVHKIQAPTAQSFLTYVLLCTVFTTWLACRSGEQGLIPVLRNRGWKYFLVAAADVEANFLLVKAYQYTSLTSVQLLDCFTIPVVLALSWILLKVRYKIVHILGVGVALLGVGCLVWADLEEDKTSQIASNRLLGDMLCLTGAALYGVSNIAEEFVVKTYNRVEFLGMLGLFGSVVNGIQLAILERTELAVINWEEWEEVSFLLGYTMCLFFLYVTLPIVIKNASATAANLSLLTADCYSLLIGIYIFNNQFHWLYVFSFFLFFIGVLIYCLQPTPLGTAQYREISVTELQGDLELANQTPFSTNTYNSIGSARDSPGFEHIEDSERTKSMTVVSISHAVSVHAVDEGERGAKRNGNARFPYENTC